jgi:hypothetical protein
MAVISSINKWQGYTVGASRAISHVAGSLSKHRRIIHEARAAGGLLLLCLHAAAVATTPAPANACMLRE